jgi:alpha/beta superfamily hydrolase
VIRPVSWCGDLGVVRGMLYAPAGRPRVGVVACNALWEEGECSRQFLCMLGRELTRSSIALLRFDYGGLGESDGDECAATLRSCLTDIRDAVAVMRGMGRDIPLVLLGIRLGANLLSYLEMEAARLILLEPITDFRTYWRELEVETLANTPGVMLTELADDLFPAIGYYERYGHRIPASFMTHLTEAEQTKRGSRTRPPVCLLGLRRNTRDGALQRWADHRFGANVPVQIVREPVDRFWRSHHRETKVPDGYMALVARLAAMLRPLGAGALDAGSSWDLPISVEDTEIPDFVSGTNGRTCCVRHTVPATGAPGHGCIVIVGPVPHDRGGPQRMYVQMARHFLLEHGWSTIRFDPIGCADSDGAWTADSARLRRDQLDSCLDRLRADGFDQFLLVGVCSGAWHALRVAAARSDVCALAMVNPPFLNWQSRLSALLGLARRFVVTVRQGVGPVQLVRLFGGGPLRYRLGSGPRPSRSAVARRQQQDMTLLGEAPFPLLIIYGMRSSYVAGFRAAFSQHAFPIFQRNAPTQLTILPEGNDTFVLCRSRTQLLKALTAWLSTCQADSLLKDRKNLPRRVREVSP